MATKKTGIYIKSNSKEKVDCPQENILRQDQNNALDVRAKMNLSCHICKNLFGNPLLLSSHLYNDHTLKDLHKSNQVMPLFPEVKQLFVYGTLRSDDRSGALWHKQVHNSEINPRCTRAILRGFGLQKHQRFGQATVMRAEDEQTEGQALQSDKWKELMTMCDQIEGQPKFQSRAVVQIEVGDDDNHRDSVQSYVYFMNNAQRSHLTPYKHGEVINV